ncbi:YraN family protein [Suttonella sp. R2A3]|uniref:YraN family protein n=1 Tax=Suttonella sp. R2A3 TaxID=2908648 RepID=UPI001F4115C6|nr:YraN family protein [Suttonella sp. R2A3]UJF24685.1 YraN family protein [Suttonella sp. R2A3]
MLFSKIAEHLQRGQHGERLAAGYLRKHGLAILANNVRSRYGEIDLIAQDGDTVVFIEVRTRKAGNQVSAAASITPTKQRKWHNSAADYLQKQFGNNPPPCRFDAVCIEIDGRKADIQWLKGVM